MSVNITPSRHLHRLTVSDEIFERFPSYIALVLYVSDLDNTQGGQIAEQLLRKAEQTARSRISTDTLNSHPRISSWRAAYSSFGAKPSKYLCSAEALLKRVLKGNDLPTVSPIVDLYNALSLNHCIPIGGEDWDQLASSLTLRFANGDEPFITQQQGEIATDYPEAGEVIWCDAAGVTCRRFNWRQCTRTAVTTETRNAYFVLDRLPPLSVEELQNIGKEMSQMLEAIWPHCKVSHDLLCI